MDKILIVAPETDPPLPFGTKEVQNVINYLPGAVVRMGWLRADEVLQAINSEQPEIILFITHGDGEGIYVSDGQISTAALASVVRNSQVELIFLNTCNSVFSAESIYARTGVDVIATLGDIKDEDAFATSSQFAWQLGRGKTYREAYFAARTPDFIYIPDRLMSPPFDDELSRRIETNTRYIEQIQEILNGRPGKPGVIGEMNTLNQRLNSLIISLWALVIVFILVAIAVTTVALSYFQVMP